MSSDAKFYVRILRRISYGVAFLIYHTLSLIDQAYAAYLAFKPPQVSDPASGSRFVHPAVRSKSYWSTTRLLCLSPGAGVKPLDGGLLCNTTIKILSWSWLFGERRYDAISYCWGDSTATKIIHLDGEPFPITETLHVALQNLRLPHASRLVWADQICIDQSKTAIDERNHQVQRMGEIYEAAETVIVWLGQATKASNMIFHGLSQVNDQTAELSDTYRHTELLPGHAIFESIRDELLRSASRYLRASDEPLIQETLASEMNNLLANPWFTRIWVIQEAVLAGNLLLQAGRQQVSWKRFAGCVRSLQHITGTKPRHALPVYDIEMLRNGRSEAEWRNRDFLKLLTVFRGRQASDPRDKINGLLGLVAYGRSEITFRANYLKSFEQVFMDFTLWHIKVKGNLDVLADCCAEEENDHVMADGLKERRLPSWATDWSLNTAGERSDLVYDLKTSIQVYHASKSRRADAHTFPIFEENTSGSSKLFPIGTALVLTGLLIDTIAKMVDRAHTWGDDDPCSATWPAWKDFALEKWHENPYGSRQGRLNALRQVVTVDKISRSERASPSDGAALRFLLDEKNTQLYHGSQVQTAGPMESSTRADFGRSEPPRGHSKEYIQRWKSTHIGRKIFRTKRGYLGLSCQHVREGDKICILWGGRLPFILREYGSTLLNGIRGQQFLIDDTVVLTYKLIGGECYVHGLADGEGLDIAEKEGLLPKKICLV